MKKYNEIEFINKLKEYGYTYINGKYENQFSKLLCYDKDGYIVYVQFNKIENRKCGTSPFHANNPSKISNYIYSNIQNANVLINLENIKMHNLNYVLNVNVGIYFFQHLVM